MVGTLASCEKDEDKVTISPSGAITAAASTSNVTLLQANAAQTAVVYTWNMINFTMSGGAQEVPPAAKYQIQLAKTADGFGHPGVLDAGDNASKEVLVKDLNLQLINMGLTPRVATTVYARVAATLGTDSRTFFSAPIALTVTPYEECLAPARFEGQTWALVGPAGNGWPAGPPATGPAEDGIVLTWNCVDEAFEARTALNAGPFKFRLNKKWDVNMGGPAGDLTQGVAVSHNGADLNIATAGTYTVKLKFNGTETPGTTTTGTVTVTP